MTNLVIVTMGKRRVKIGIIIGYVAMIAVALGITSISISVLAKPYTSVQPPTKEIVGMTSDMTQTKVLSDKAKEVLFQANMVDTIAINTAFLKKMYERGELLSSADFALRITDYYNTLVAVLTALFVLFTLVTYMTIKSKFEGKFEDKARDLEDTQRQKIIDELRNMLCDSKRIEEVIISAVGGDIEDKIVTHEEVERLSDSIVNCGKNINSLMIGLDDVNKKQNELYGVVTDLLEQVANDACIINSAIKIYEAEDHEVVENSSIEKLPFIVTDAELDTPSEE